MSFQHRALRFLFAITASRPHRRHLRERLARARLVDEAPEPPWTYGTSLVYLRELLAHWRDAFDWRAEEAKLNAFPRGLRTRWSSK